MAVPGFQDLTLPILKISAAGELQTTSAVEHISDQFNLTEDERLELLPSGRQTRIANRAHWALAYLSKAGLLARTGRGRYMITELGRDVLKSPPQRISIRFRNAKKDRPTEEVGAEIESLDGRTPEEQIDSAFEIIITNLRADLLSRIIKMQPLAFEKLVLDLMEGMGYGDKGSRKHLGRSGDGGVDGIINEDALGLDVIYLQAKRYAPDNGIGVEKMREFAGALDERGAIKGVFVTTSYFAQPAKQYAQRSPKRLILIDGEQLTQLLIKHGVAVRPYRSLEFKKLDPDYFDEPDA